jgi:hypothetical protein
MRRREAAALREAGWVVLEYRPFVRLVDAVGALQSKRAARAGSVAALRALPAFSDDPFADRAPAAA